MCLIAIAWRAHPAFDLIVAGNRDEAYARPTAALGFWESAPQVLAGRDLEAGGTWMGITCSGRFAAITNFRDASAKRSHARSRGLLVAQFLTSTIPAAQMMAHARATRNDYQGFNLVLADDTSCMTYDSHADTVTDCAPGVVVLSNGPIGAPWPKCTYAESAMRSNLCKYDIIKNCLEFLMDTKIPTDADLPATGMPIEKERALGAVFVSIPPHYGTRSSAVFTRSAQEISATEISFAAAGCIGQKSVSVAKTVA
jgi:uncharacterized protein with NRDE domain